MYRSLEQATDDLGPYDGLLNEIVTGGWRTYGEKHPHRFQDFLARNQADLVHRYMELRARAVLAGVPGFELSPFGEQTFWIKYRHLYLIRLHLLYPNVSIAVNETLESIGFLIQGPGQLSLPNMPDPVTKLNLGYLLTPTKTGPASVHLVCPNGQHRYHWEWTLSEGTAEGEEPIRFPVSPPDDHGPLARPKAPEREAEEETEAVIGDDKDA